MGDPALVAAWLTALGTVALALAAFIQLPLLILQLRALATQVRLAREHDIGVRKRQREWETLRVCQRYDFDPVLEAASVRIAAAREAGRMDETLVKRDMIAILNYFDGIAIGIEQGLYIEAMVKDQLGGVLDYVVKDYVQSRRVDAEGLDCMMALHAKWFPPPAVQPDIRYRAATD